MKTTPFSLILGILAVLLLGGVYGWLYLQIQSKNTEIALATAEIQARDGEDSRLAALESLVEATSNERLELEGRFVSNDGATLFLKEVESLGDSIGVTAEIVSVRDVELVPPDELYAGLSVSLSAEGTFDQMVKLIKSIESLPYPVIVDQSRLEARALEKKKVWYLSVVFTVIKKK
jgi:Tfp pilus assembly protein PilO